MRSTFEDFAPVIVFVSIAFVLIWLVTRAYTLSSKTKLQVEQGRGAWIAALVSSLVGLFAAAIYGIPALQDFDNREYGFGTRYWVPSPCGQSASVLGS